MTEIITAIIAADVLLLMLSLMIMALKGFTIGETLRICWWAWLHPRQAVTRNLDDEPWNPR